MRVLCGLVFGMSFVPISVVAVDPGQHTGWCLVGKVPEGSERNVPTYKVLAVGEWEFKWDDYEKDLYLGLMQFTGEVRDACVEHGLGSWPRLWVIEDFYLVPGVGGRGMNSKREGISPVRVTTGLLHMLHADCVGVSWDVVRQQPSEIAQFTGKLGGDRLRRKGLWVVGSEHKRDAVRHALQWCRKLNYELIAPSS